MRWQFVRRCVSGVSRRRTCSGRWTASRRWPGDTYGGSPDEQARLAQRLSRSADPEGATQFVNELEDAENVRYFFDEDLAATNRMVELYDVRSLSSGQTGNLHHRHLDRRIEASDLVHVARNGDISESRIIVQRSDDVFWLEGGEGSRLSHIQARHMEGDSLEEPAGQFPVGEEVMGRTMPERLTRDEVLDLIYDGVRRGDSTSQGDRIRYYFEPIDEGYPDSGISEMQVVVRDSGGVYTAYPISGESVLRWVPELNDGSGDFVETQ